MSFSSQTTDTNESSSRSNSVSDDGSKELRSNIRDSRRIQPEQWQLPEIQEKFQKVKI
jgi:hypothetical protein